MTRHGASTWVAASLVCAATLTSASAWSEAARRAGGNAGHAVGLAGDVEDARTALAVHVALLDQLGRDGMNIHVDVIADKAVLVGTVVAHSSQELAEEIALSVPAVRSVDNQITVESRFAPHGPPIEQAVHHAASEVDDAVLESHVKMRLLESMGISAFRIEVEASDGIVSLRGTLNDADHRDIALRTARSTPGTKRVLDLLRVR
jgi:hyperosmotically inducible periplasmic protein